MIYLRRNMETWLQQPLGIQASVTLNSSGWRTSQRGHWAAGKRGVAEAMRMAVSLDVTARQDLQ